MMKNFNQLKSLKMVKLRKFQLIVYSLPWVEDHILNYLRIFQIYLMNKVMLN